MAKTKKLTFDQLCKLEPKLRYIQAEAESFVAGDSFCANRVFYGNLKLQLVKLVGHHVRAHNGPEELSTSQAYDTAYWTIYNSLPDCRNCLCIRIPY